MDKALKQRLVGASVLIALAVVVLPMLLGGRGEGTIQEPKTIELPAKPPDLDFETRRYPIGEQDSTPNNTAPDNTVSELPSPSRIGSAQPTPPVAGDIPGDVASRGQDEPLPQLQSQDLTESDESGKPAQNADPALELIPQPEPATVEQNIAPEDHAVMPGRYIVQVASFGSSDNATRLSESLQRKGYSVLVDSVKSEVGTLSRVRIGPFDSAAQANNVVSELKQEISGIKPRVVDLRPEQAAQVSSPVDPLIRWVVQVGSFSSVVNADKLVARLRLEGLSAYQEAVKYSASTLYRVRIGPFLERDEAFRIEQQVQERMALDGVVMSAD